MRSFFETQVCAVVLFFCFVFVNPSATSLDCTFTNQTLLLPPPNTPTSEELGVSGESQLGVALFMDGFQ